MSNFKSQSINYSKFDDIYKKWINSLEKYIKDEINQLFKLKIKYYKNNLKNMLFK